MPETLASEIVAPRRTWLRRLVLVAGVLLVLASAVALRGWLLRSSASSRDFISYWASAKLLAAHRNPYDRAAVLALELQAGGHYQQAFLMRNPPWALFLALPLAWMSAPVGALAWMLAIIAAALLSIRLIQPHEMKRVPLSLLLFAPVVICAGAEQTGVFILLGLAIFIRFAQRRPWVAGLALTIPCAKPHLLLLLGLVLALECWRRRDLRILAGLALGLLAATALAIALDPLVWSHYFAAMRAEPVETDFYPNVANLLRALIDPHALWPALLPTAAGAGFTAWYWMRNRADWSWPWHGALILALSVFTAPYSWPSDQALFLPALLASAPRASTVWLRVLAVMNVCALLVFARNPVLGKPVYLWMAPAWMTWCIWACLRPDPERCEAKPDGVATLPPQAKRQQAGR